MTELNVVLEKLEHVIDTQKTQGADIKELSKGFSILATQSEQITNLQTQTTGLWSKYDAITGPDSVQERIREHQKRCPREEMHRTFGWIWKVLSAHSVILLAMGGWLFWIVTNK